MFDRIYAPRVTEHVTKNVDVHEHRAPTDESIKLYKEMLEKARAEVVKVTLDGMQGNTLSNARVEVRQQFDSMDTKYQFWFRLNSEDHKIEFNLDDFDGLREKIAHKIVVELTRGLRWPGAREGAATIEAVARSGVCSGSLSTGDSTV